MVLIFESVDEILKCAIYMKPSKEYFSGGDVYCAVQLSSVHEIPTCDNSNESYWAVPFFGAADCAIQGGPTF